MTKSRRFEKFTGDQETVGSFLERFFGKKQNETKIVYNENSHSLEHLKDYVDIECVNNCMELNLHIEKFCLEKNLDQDFLYYFYDIQMELINEKRNETSNC